VGEVRDMLDAAGVPPSRLALEVTETALAFDSHVARDVVGALSALGIAVSIDDFGIGYTGLSQLRTMHVSEIKVDRTFVSGLVDNPQDRAIVTSIIDLAHGLGCVVTAEGVETRETADWLTAAGCDHGQGYLWMRPSDWRDVATVPPLTALTALPAPTQLPGLPAPAALPGIAAGRAPTTQVVR
jgi:EAL domain-containing protein (putative c-di-GMP-specific phosphodiesterase class I)